MKHLKTFTFIVSFIFSLSSHSQQLVVRDIKTREPVESVVLYNPSKTISSYTDKKGRADVSKFPPGDTIYFQHPSYKQIVLPANELEKTEYTIFLENQYILMDEFVISASKSNESTRNLPYMIDIMDEVKIRNANAQTSAELLLNTGNVQVQKSQGGGGSPVLRGFEANKILLVVDGIRMNNAIYRSGHLQNSITIDHAILERTEIIFGPTSVMYGSDALGGVIHYITKEPELAGKDAFLFKTQVHTQYSTANKAWINHLDVTAAGNTFSSLSSITHSNFGDLSIGKNLTFSEQGYGLTPYYVTQINEVDSTVSNTDPRIQKNTGYRQLDVLQKFRYAPVKQLDLIANIQYSTSSNIDRYDNLIEFGKDGYNLKYAEWYYGPQDRFLAALKSIVKVDNPFFTNFTTNLAYQNISEDRISRQFREAEKLFQEETVDIVNLNFDFFKLIKSGTRLNYGLEFSANKVKSVAYYKDIYTGEESYAPTRYPDGGSNTQHYAAYVNYKWQLHPKIIVTSGLRFTYAHLTSHFYDKTLVELPFETVEINASAPTGSISLVYHPRDTWQINLIGSTGFRIPNVDDYGKIRAKSGLITMPGDQVNPEYAYNLEGSITKSIYNHLKINGTFYHTWVRDAIVRADYAINGVDSILYDGYYYHMITNTNADHARIYGISLSLLGDFEFSGDRKLSFKSTWNYTKGELNGNEPLAHISPVFGRTNLDYQPMKKLTLQVSSLYNGKKDMDEMSPLGEDNEQFAQEDGYAAWYIFNAKAHYQLNKVLAVQFAAENIMDEHYRVFASGVSAPGRNFMFTLRANL